MPTPLSDLMLNDRGFVFDPASGETFQLSTTALRIVRLLQQGGGTDAVLARVLEEFEVDEHTARRDLDDFLELIGQLGWRFEA
jgi:PqqD family protein of HPr-rel-A system